MGYWSADAEGNSFAVNDGDEMLWGDAPADIMDVAVKDIRRTFREDTGREPTKAEVLSGLLFSMMGIEGDWEPDEPPTLPDKKRLPAHWCSILGMRIMDPDGWRRRDDETTWDTPVTLAEFQERAGLSTVWYDPKVRAERSKR